MSSITIGQFVYLFVYLFGSLIVWIGVCGFCFWLIMSMFHVIFDMVRHIVGLYSSDVYDELDEFDFLIDRIGKRVDELDKKLFY